jgi:3-oxoacyl-[acyl-carrier protein] reductase
MKILITGGASGLGLAITKKLAQEPSNIVYFTYRSSEENARSLERECANTKAFHVDFNATDSIEAFMNELVVLAPDVLINNAITGYTQNHFHKMDTTVFENSFKANVYPTIRITQKFISESRKRKSGKIITILTSYILNKPPIGLAEYVANKAYLHSMAKSWAIENAAFGITSNCISPSFMQTNLTSNTDSRLIENMIADNPNKSLLKGDEVAEAVSFLVSATSQINGSNLIINAAKDLI